MRAILRIFAKPRNQPIVRWAIMVAAIFWTLVYQASTQSVNVPQFVYVNF